MTATTPTRAATADVLDQAAEILEANGHYQGHLYDTRQAAGSTPLDGCRVDVMGALNIAAHGTPRYAGSPAVYAAEQALTDRLQVVSLVTWNDEKGRTAADITQALRDTAANLRAEATA
ncbi:DUF6197 family protein [Streptomyces lasiicapitis]|uniref:DUF6197 family protein n=1 Tax=Streptomyces lasiicapitis TaxID=1923961 RepID=UPI003697C511